MVNSKEEIMSCDIVSYYMFLLGVVHVLFFKQKTAYEMRISDWSSDVCSSDLVLLYIVSRRGYRGANVNTPAFESAFTTGGTGCNNPGGACPDLRPFQKTGEAKLTDVEVGAKKIGRASCKEGGCRSV